MLPITVLVVLLAFFIAMALFSRNYLKVAPNAVAVLSGRKRKLADGRVVGYRMVRVARAAHSASGEGGLSLTERLYHSAGDQARPTRCKECR